MYVFVPIWIDGEIGADQKESGIMCCETFGILTNLQYITLQEVI